MTKLHKLLLFILTLAAVTGMFWRWAINADARYAKSVEAEAIHSKIIAETEQRDTELTQDVAALGNAFQYEQFDRAIDRKRDQIREIDRDLSNKKLDDDSRVKLKLLREQLQLEVEKLMKKQEQYSPKGL